MLAGYRTQDLGFSPSLGPAVISVSFGGEDRG